MKDKLNNKMLFKILLSILDTNKHTNIGRNLLLLFNKICLENENIFENNLCYLSRRTKLIYFCCDKFNVTDRQ